MAIFPSQPLQPSPLSRALSTRLRNRPFVYFGLPFLTIVVLSSFGLETFTRTRYDLHNQKVQTISKEDELGMSKGRKRVDIKEEYYRLQNLGSSASPSISSLCPSSESQPALTSSPKTPSSFLPSSTTWDGENVRVPRPGYMPAWGPGPAIASRDGGAGVGEGGDAPILGTGGREGDRLV